MFNKILPNITSLYITYNYVTTTTLSALMFQYIIMYSRVF